MHIPVLLEETMTYLHPQPNYWYIDATFGRGGHTKRILAIGARVVAFDHDQEAIRAGESSFKQEVADHQLILVRSNFDQLEKELQTLQKTQEIDSIHGVLFDFGLSSPQLESSSRGFSFQTDAPLDMRMDDRLGVQAKDLLAVLGESQLSQLFWEFGGEEHHRTIAKVIVRERQTKPITTTRQLTDLVSLALHGRHSHLHPATKVFQALRIAVNSELESISQALPQAEALLSFGGRCVTISFHEGEDSLVKSAFKTWAAAGKGEVLTKKPIFSTEQELQKNPRARSARLRAYEKTRH